MSSWCDANGWHRRSLEKSPPGEFAMEDVWRLSAADSTELIKAKEGLPKEAATAPLAWLGAASPRIIAVVDHKFAEVLWQLNKHHVWRL
jgi:hypothetical protein